VDKSPLLLSVLLTGCVVNVADGPYVGECAAYPDGVYTYGEIGIGTCLAGPTDVQFIEIEGRPWLVVVNADPFINFGVGSSLLIDFESLDLTKRRNLMHEISAYAHEMDRYVGAVAHLADRELLLVTGRLSEDALTRDNDDRIHVLDISDPTNPTPWLYGNEITVKDDPFPIVVSQDQSRVYTVNLSDHSVSVIDAEAVPLEVIDVVGPAKLGKGLFLDADASGSYAELDGPIEVDAAEVISDRWTLSWLDGTYRLWIPRDGGLERWNTGDGQNYSLSALGLELDPSYSSSIEEIVDPYVAWVGGVLTTYFSDRGQIRSASSLGTAGDWELSSNIVLSGSVDSLELGSPSLTSLDEDLVMFYDARSAEGEAASLGLAQLAEDGAFRYSGEVAIEPTSAGESFEDPFVINEHGLLRMWFSRWDGTSWTIAYTEGFDGLSWSEPEDQISLPGGHVAAPVITYSNGRYLLWAATSHDGLQWEHSSAWSHTGLEWQDLSPILQANDPFDLARPPRASLQVEATGAWSIDARDLGPMSIHAAAGDTTSSAGFSFTVASGHSIPTGVLGEDYSINGCEPGAFAEISGVPTLFVTGIGNDTQTRIGAIQLIDGDWVDVGEPVIDHENASHPVVLDQGSEWRLFYAAPGEDGRTRMYSATSATGLKFDRDASDLVQSGESWDDLGQYPHSADIHDNGEIWLWYAGDNGSRLRIGAASSADGGDTFMPEPGLGQDYQFGPGAPGTFDDSGVKDPYVFREGDTTAMYYSGFDGSVWHIGYAERTNTGWSRRVNPFTGEGIPSMAGVSGSFSVGGVHSPVVAAVGSTNQIYYAGYDSFKHRIGYANGKAALYPIQAFPTVGDTLVFDTTRGDDESSVIELAQSLEAFTTSGTGTSGLVLDEERGFLYVPSKLHSHVYVIDIRDDSTGDMVDANYLDLEALIQVPSTAGAMGFRSGLLLESRNQLLLTSREPDGVVIVDLNDIEDNSIKESIDGVASGVLPLRDLRENEGGITLASIGGAGMALSPDQQTLLVTNFRGNGVSVFDLGLGLFGEEIQFINAIGENPHVVDFSPDGRWAVVGNYLGSVIDDEVSSSLAVIDMDPNSEQYLEVVTWIVNK
jgi:DNA-binding beta-propeller fold protein YncE